MADMSKKFIDMGAEVSVDKAAAAKEANKAFVIGKLSIIAPN